MTEETIFAAALERPDPADRVAFLNDACAGDTELHHRVETLLASHGTPGFLETPAIRQAVEGFGDETRTGPSAEPADSLDFLAPSEHPGSIGRLDHYEVR